MKDNTVSNNQPEDDHKVLENAEAFRYLDIDTDKKRFDAYRKARVSKVRGTFRSVRSIRDLEGLLFRIKVRVFNTDAMTVLRIVPKRNELQYHH